MADGTPSCSSQGSKTTSNEKPKKVPKTYKFYFDIFFDGTGNNYYNTQTRLDANKAMEKAFSKKAFEQYENAFHASDSATMESKTNSAVWLAEHGTKSLDSNEKKAVIEYGKNTDFGTSSYENYYTNVYHLYNFFKYRFKEALLVDNFPIGKIYIEGIGTASTNSKGAEDETLGGAFGAGETGIRAKVLKARQQVIDAIEGKLSKKWMSGDETQIEFTVCGFSRGAAAARHFVHIILNDYFPLQSNILGDFEFTLKLETQLSKYKVSEIKFKFVGLFDTVSSFSLNGTAAQLSNVSELGLNSLSAGNVEKVYHLVARDEHRKNFAVTNISSAGASPMNPKLLNPIYLDSSTSESSGKGIEIILPGVHSDIGGSYFDDVTEELTVYNVDVTYMSDNDKKIAEQDILNLVNAGWFDLTDLYRDFDKDNNPNPFLTENEPIRNALTFWNEVKIRRCKKDEKGKITGGISNKYARIPFTLMYTNYQPSRFDDIKIKGSLDVSLEPNILNDKFIGEIAKKMIQNPSSPGLNVDELKQLRKEYFHFSAHFGGEKAGIAPYGPRFDNGKRTRKIHQG